MCILTCDGEFEALRARCSQHTIAIAATAVSKTISSASFLIELSSHVSWCLGCTMDCSMVTTCG
jgi:hypothetical protein